MPEINIQGNKIEASRSVLLNSLVLSKDEAIGKRTGWQLFVDGILSFFSTPKYKTVIATVDELFHPQKKSTSDFTVKLIKLADLADDDRFYDALRVGVAKEQGGGYSVRVFLKDAAGVESHEVMTHFDDELELPEEFFENVSHSALETEYKLKENIEAVKQSRKRFIAVDGLVNLVAKSNGQQVVDRHSTKEIEQKRRIAFDALFKLVETGNYQQIVDVMSDVLKPNGSKAFEGNILKLDALVAKDQKERFYSDLRLEVNPENDVSVVKVFLNELDGSPLVECRFVGDFTPHDRFFEKVDGYESRYQLRPNNTPLKEHIRDLHIKSRDMNQVWKNSPDRDRVLNDITKRVNRQIVDDIRRDQDRTEAFYPEQSKVNDTRVVTQESNRQMIRKYFSPDLQGASQLFLALYNDYDALSREKQKAFLGAIDGTAEEKKIPLDEDLQLVKERFDALSSDEKKDMKGCFEFLYKNKFKGTGEEFHQRMNALPLKEKAISLVGMQGGQALLAGLKTRILLHSNPDIWDVMLTEVEDSSCLHWKIIGVDEQNGTVDFEATYQADYKPANAKLPPVARAVNTAKCTVTISEGETLENARVYFHEEEVNFTLSVFKIDGKTVPTECKNVQPVVEVTRSVGGAVDILLQRKRVLERAQPNHFGKGIIELAHRFSQIGNALESSRSLINRGMH